MNLHPRQTGGSIGGVLPLCRTAAGEFYPPSGWGGGTTEEDANFLLVVAFDGAYQGVYIDVDIDTVLKSAVKYNPSWNDLSDVAAYVPFKINKNDWLNEWGYNTRMGNIMKKYTTEDCFYAAGKGELTFMN